MGGVWQGWGGLGGGYKKGIGIFLMSEIRIFSILANFVFFKHYTCFLKSFRLHLI